MKLFMAEYPDLKNFEIKHSGSYNFYDPAFANTNDTDQI